MKKKSNISSITKNKAWSLILNAKFLHEDSKNIKKTITVKEKNFSFTYSLQEEKIIKKNFYLNQEVGELFDIFLPIVLNGSRGPYLIGHLAQSLDGFIATGSGESKYISCKENIEHIHRIRAIADIILVGTKTVMLDNPHLTTRLVKGDNPMRVILDPKNKLKGTEKIFKQHDKKSFRIIGINRKSNYKNIFKLPVSGNAFKIKDVVSLFKRLGKNIIFIEGGGYTVSEFYKSNFLNRLHICLSPTIIGAGKNSFLIGNNKSIKNIKNHNIKYYAMGKDILCDMSLTISRSMKYK